MNKLKKSTIYKVLTWFSITLFFEILFSIIMKNSFSIKSVIHIGIYSFILAIILTLLTNRTGTKKDSILVKIILFLYGFLFSFQCVFYRIFKVYFSIYNLEISDQVTSFLKEAILLILQNSFYILLFFLPFILSFWIERKRKYDKNTKEEIFSYLACLLVAISCLLCNINTTKKESNGIYDLYFNINNISLNIHKLGVLNTYSVDIYRYIFGFYPNNIQTVSMTSETNKTRKEHKLEFSFKETSDEKIQALNQYLAEETATAENEYTGMFEGYNLIYITAESFSEIGISKELTPTLYQLTHSGFQFKNYYTPNALSTIGGEFQTLTGLYPDYSILRKWRDGTNYFPYGLATVFQGLGYDTHAYHNNTYTFQSRNQYMASQGFKNYMGCGNGLETRIDCSKWPQSDEEMMKETVNDYLYQDKPFLAYYMTVSGHFSYSFQGNAMASKNKKLVENLEKSESAKAYVATQIELDRALESLMKDLEKEKKLEKTVIVLMADHYPYELDLEAINSLSETPRDNIEVNHNALIIWNPLIQDTVVEKACMSTDVLPTIYNLFGIDYDSRLLTGRDILSDSYGIAIMSDYSWITEEGKYDSRSNSFVPKKEVEEDYVNKINKMINSRLTISKWILETDYYRYLFSE